MCNNRETFAIWLHYSFLFKVLMYLSTNDKYSTDSTDKTSFHLLLNVTCTYKQQHVTTTVIELLTNGTTQYLGS